MCPSSLSASTIPQSAASPPDLSSAFNLQSSLRVWLYASKILAPRFAPEWLSTDRLPLLFAACMLHDIGSAAHLADKPERFEVSGADEAAGLIKKYNADADTHEQFTEDQIHSIWTAIAVHTSPHIGERISPLARIIREGPLIDFSFYKNSLGDDDQELKDVRVEAEKRFPRLEVEKALGDAVVEHAVHIPEKAPSGSWPGDLLRAKREDPGWEGVNKGF
ncbi:MAG: hypothetical protein Q9227_004918 [Pyrenula ochraceoflavens]